jgi:hypothetical protein
MADGQWARSHQEPRLFSRSVGGSLPSAGLARQGCSLRADFTPGRICLVAARNRLSGLLDFVTSPERRWPRRSENIANMPAGGRESFCKGTMCRPFKLVIFASFPGD